MEIRVEGLADFINVLENSNEAIDKEIQKTVIRIGNRLLKKVKLKTPVDTGLLRDSWRSKKGEDNYTRYVFNPVKYATYVELGHRVVGGKGGGKGRRKGNKKETEKREAKSKGYVEGVYMLTRSVAEIEDNIDKDFERMMKRIWKEAGL